MLVWNWMFRTNSGEELELMQIVFLFIMITYKFNTIIIIIISNHLFTITNIFFKLPIFQSIQVLCFFFVLCFISFISYYFKHCYLQNYLTANPTAKISQSNTRDFSKPKFGLPHPEAGSHPFVAENPLHHILPWLDP